MNPIDARDWNSNCPGNNGLRTYNFSAIHREADVGVYRPVLVIVNAMLLQA